ncbi:hypothetical protein CEXT_349111 [Caerostris extrusa]|uniref:Uncharacterized protein n=1 Tax=Caerostris extrusa TaxID=172846 RepID=A0AAV4P241_CAEEX|nr:hypothetical protein CEXT_349111 [Caerostris extrusa]
MRKSEYKSSPGGSVVIISTRVPDLRTNHDCKDHHPVRCFCSCLCQPLLTTSIINTGSSISSRQQDVLATMLSTMVSEMALGPPTPELRSEMLLVTRRVPTPSPTLMVAPEEWTTSPTLWDSEPPSTPTSQEPPLSAPASAAIVSPYAPPIAPAVPAVAAAPVLAAAPLLAGGVSSTAQSSDMVPDLDILWELDSLLQELKDHLLVNKGENLYTKFHSDRKYHPTHRCHMI